MRWTLSPHSFLLVTLFYALACCAAHSHTNVRKLHSRNPTGSFSQMYDAANYQNGSAAPAASPDDAPGQTVIVGGTGADDSSQRPGCDTIFISTAQVDGSVTSGWKSIPNVVGFYVDRNITYNSVTAPIYIESGKDFSKVKRVVVTGPGKPRDAWKYSNLFRNSLLCAVSNSSMAVTQEEILIAAPIWLAQDDSQAGAGQSSDLYFSDGGWSVGSKSKGPGKADISSYTVMDDLIKRFANQEEFPALTSVTVAGHSLGASFSQRYAMVRNDDASTDSLLRFWIGNPGAYVWPSPDRPVTPSNTSCASEVDEWAYGVSRSLPAYVKGVKNNVSAVYERYRSRVIQYALGMDDDGPGDTHCEAQ